MEFKIVISGSPAERLRDFRRVLRQEKVKTVPLSRHYFVLSDLGYSLPQYDEIPPTQFEGLHLEAYDITPGARGPHVIAARVTTPSSTEDWTLRDEIAEHASFSLWPPRYVIKEIEVLGWTRLILRLLEAKTPPLADVFVGRFRIHAQLGKTVSVKLELLPMQGFIGNGQARFVERENDSFSRSIYRRFKRYFDRKASRQIRKRRVAHARPDSVRNVIQRGDILRFVSKELTHRYIESTVTLTVSLE